MPEPIALLDTPGGGAVLFEDLQRTLTVSAAAFAPVCDEAERIAAAGGHVVVLLDYELGHVFEPASGAPPGGPLARFLVFARRRVLAAADVAALLAAAAREPAGIEDFAAQRSAAGHAAAVARIRDYIAAGDCYQVNLTFPFGGRVLGDPLALHARLRAMQPVAHGAFVHSGDGCILSFSPELFIERDAAGCLRSRPMKGTAARGNDPVHDAAARAALQRSAKDRAENVMIVDLIRSDLGRVADPGSVRVESLCEVETYPSVHQMTSTVAAQCRAPLADVLAALFPCGSITGAPKVRAMQIVRELEPSPRGLYTGAIGWLGEGGRFHFSVAIRTLLVAADGSLRYGVGSGIVWDSDAAAEYAECLLKARFVSGAEPGFRLIETLRLDAGRYPLRERHRERLQASATRLGFAFDAQAFLQALDGVAGVRPQGVYRVRLTLGHAGDIETTTVPLLPLAQPVRACLAEGRLQAADPWLRHKTTQRARYDAELARIAAVDPALFDAIFLNERGEVCEGARSNVFVRRRSGEPLLTPPLACGLLPGVLRRQLLASGEAVEAVLREEDLRGAAELHLGNALRGLVRVSL